MEAFSEAPMRESRRHSVSPERINNVRRANLISHRIKIEVEALGDFRNFVNRSLEFFPLIIGQDRSPPFAKAYYMYMGMWCKRSQIFMKKRRLIWAVTKRKRRIYAPFPFPMLLFKQLIWNLRAIREPRRGYIDSGDSND